MSATTVNIDRIMSLADDYAAAAYNYFVNRNSATKWNAMVAARQTLQYELQNNGSQPNSDLASQGLAVHLGEHGMEDIK